MHSVNLNALSAYLLELGFTSGEKPQLAPIAGGQSNPTYLLSVGTWRCVLRTKPPGTLLPSAHAIDREFRVMKALENSEVPVPKMLAYCEDESIIGRHFYLMEFIDGRSVIDQSLPGMSTSDRHAIYDEMNKVTSNLHALDYKLTGLDSFGKPGSFFSRQIARWTRQCQESKIPVTKEMNQLIEWLPEHIPSDDETTLVHGDFRLDNLILHPTEPKVLAVLDWELSTLGHPMADFAYHCMSWRIPASLWRGVGGLDLQILGIPSEQEYVRAYELQTGREAGKNWEFYMAYNLFRMSAILHGIGERAAQGNAASENAIETAAVAIPLSKIGWECAQRY
jgi:acyl-CoA dehydrogenase